MTTVSVDFLQQITLLGKQFLLISIDPMNRKQTIIELKKVLTKPLLISDYKKIWKALYYGIALFNCKQCGAQTSFKINRFLQLKFHN